MPNVSSTGLGGGRGFTSAQISVVTPLASGSSITASRFNSLVGQSSAAISRGSAYEVAAYLWGAGFGNRGYGMTTWPAAITLQSAGNPISYSNLDWILRNLSAWQGTPLTGYSSSAVAPGQTISVANDTSIKQILASLDHNRFDVVATNMTFTVANQTDVRASTWGKSNTYLTGVYQVSFPDEDSTRYFFNTGGEVRFSFAHSDTSDAQNAAWNKILSNFVLGFRATSTHELSGGWGWNSSQPIGYYQLTTAFQTIFSSLNMQVYDTGSNDITIEARVQSITGLNGGNGTVLWFRVTLGNDTGTTLTPLVANATSVILGNLRATSTALITRPAPAFAVKQPLSDPNISNVVALLHFNGANASTTALDTGYFPKTYTFSGTGSISTTQSIFNGSSLSLSGAGYVSTPSSSDFVFAGDFTIEFYAQKSANGTGYDPVCTTDTSNGNGTNGWILELSTLRGFALIYNGAIVLNAPSVTINDSTWHHWALVRLGSAITMYCDGNSVATVISSTTFLANGPFGIGGNTNQTARFAGYIADLRVTNGLARYNGTFLPPLASLPNA